MQAVVSASAGKKGSPMTQGFFLIFETERVDE
jgi:hypothetical protein